VTTWPSFALQSSKKPTKTLPGGEDASEKVSAAVDERAPVVINASLIFPPRGVKKEQPSHQSIMYCPTMATYLAIRRHATLIARTWLLEL
jgi:hypothetical protein